MKYNYNKAFYDSFEVCGKKITDQMKMVCERCNNQYRGWIYRTIIGDFCAICIERLECDDVTFAMGLGNGKTN